MATNLRAIPRSDAELLNRLRALFQQFNYEFFGGAMPSYELRIELLIAGLTIIQLRSGKYHQIPGSGTCLLHGLCLPQEQLIFINSECSKMGDDGLREVLLHEMCHAAVYRSIASSPSHDPHGQPFVTELRRLAALGELWADEQAEYYLTVPPEQQTNCPLDAWRSARRA
jgi:hypothetical protein